MGTTRRCACASAPSRRHEPRCIAAAQVRSIMRETRTLPVSVTVSMCPCSIVVEVTERMDIDLFEDEVQPGKRRGCQMSDQCHRLDRPSAGAWPECRKEPCARPYTTDCSFS